jgi:flagellar protein FlbD
MRWRRRSSQGPDHGRGPARASAPATNQSLEVLTSARPLPIHPRQAAKEGRRASGTEPMIIVTRLNGPPFALNPDLIERADATPDTVLTLVDGTKYLISESVEEVIESVRQYRASVIALAQRIDTAPASQRPLHVVPIEPEA